MRFAFAEKALDDLPPIYRVLERDAGRGPTRCAYGSGRAPDGCCVAFTDRAAEPRQATVSRPVTEAW